MSILDTKTVKKTFQIYIVISIISIIFCYIYEQFSYGEYSNFMRFLFIVPLLGGALVYFIIYLKKINIARITYNLWNSAIAVLMSGMLIRGIINISGRYTEYDKIYWVLSMIFILMTLITQKICKNKKIML